jgi:hypothetical protein
VRYLGRVPPANVSALFATSGFWLYPSSFQETSCLVAQRAVVAGAIPITARAPLSAVFEATRAGRYDLGPRTRAAPPVLLSAPLDRSWEHADRLDAAFAREFFSPPWQEAYVRAVVDAVRADAGLDGPVLQDRMRALRADMMQWAHQFHVGSRGSAPDLLAVLRRDRILPDE